MSPKMLIPISPVIKADAESDARFFSFGNIHFIVLFCSENKKTRLGRQVKDQKTLMNPSVDNKY
jgi:hypothetical protein